MDTKEKFTIQCLSQEDTHLMKALLNVFGKAFDDEKTYCKAQPETSYLKSFLNKDYVIVLVAKQDEQVIGGLVAYELQKFEQERSEIYVYDLAVSSAYRRQGVATRLINSLKQIAVDRGSYVVFLQAEQGDDPAIALYTKFGVREDVVHFDIEVK